MQNEKSAKRAKVVRRSGSGVSAPPFAAYSALLVRHDDFKNRCEGVLFESQCTAGSVEEAKQLHARIADMKKANASAKGNFDKQKCK